MRSACARCNFPVASDIAVPYLAAYVTVQNQKFGKVPAWSMSRHTAAVTVAARCPVRSSTVVRTATWSGCLGSR